MVTKARQDSTEVQIIQVSTGTLTVAIVCNTPLILNRMNNKAKHELLMPAGRKTAADKAGSLKHDPLAEFRNSPTIINNGSAPTLLGIPATALKGGMRTAALDLPGAKKSQIGRLTYVNGEVLGVYGIPKVLCSIVRSADMNRTPDVRTRCVIPRWALIADITFVRPALRESSVANLVAAAGVTVGVGDWRPEKGAGNYGQFKLVGADDADLAEIIATGGREAQKVAMREPAAYDSETEELLAWFDVEVKRRGMKIAA